MTDSSTWRTPKEGTTPLLSTYTEQRLRSMASWSRQHRDSLPICDESSQAMESACMALSQLLVAKVRQWEEAKRLSNPATSAEPLD